MRVWWCFTSIGVLTAGMILALGSNPGMAQSRAHVYLLRGLMNIFSLGMDSLAEQLNRRGIYTTVDNHADWQSLADGAAARYRAGTEGPIILIGHSLGADAVMEMAAYLGRKGVPVALVVPFDGTESFSASANVARVLNLTQHYYVSAGPGFHGALTNVDLRSDPNIDHLNIDKSPRLHARVIAEVLAIVGSRRGPSGEKPTTVSTPASSVDGDKTGSIGDAVVKSEIVPAATGGEAVKPQDAQPAVVPAKTGNGAMNATETAKPLAESGTPIIAVPEKARTQSSSQAQ
jgi:hypothetical protein